MKRALLLLLLLSFKSYSQDLTGKWKVFSYEDEIAFYNITTDSISYKNPARKNEAENFKQMSELIIFSITYSFDSNGKFVLDFPAFGNTVNGTYEVDKLNSKIVMIDDKGKKDELEFNYTNGILFVEMKMESDFIKLGLKRVGK